MPENPVFNGKFYSRYLFVKFQAVAEEGMNTWLSAVCVALGIYCCVISDDTEGLHQFSALFSLGKKGKRRLQCFC